MWLGLKEGGRNSAETKAQLARLGACANSVIHVRQFGFGGPLLFPLTASQSGRFQFVSNSHYRH